MRERCLCRCHRIADERERADGVDLRDPLAAVSACAECQPHHSVALSDSPEPHHSRTDNGESNPYLPPQQYSGEEGG